MSWWRLAYTLMSFSGRLNTGAKCNATVFTCFRPTQLSSFPPLPMLFWLKYRSAHGCVSLKMRCGQLLCYLEALESDCVIDQLIVIGPKTTLLHFTVSHFGITFTVTHNSYVLCLSCTGRVCWKRTSDVQISQVAYSNITLISSKPSGILKVAQRCFILDIDEALQRRARTCLLRINRCLKLWFESSLFCTAVRGTLTRSAICCSCGHTEYAACVSGLGSLVSHDM